MRIIDLIVLACWLAPLAGCATPAPAAGPIPQLCVIQPLQSPQPWLLVARQWCKPEPQ